MRTLHALGLVIVGMTLLALVSCAPMPTPPWKTPATPEALDQLEARTLEIGLSSDRRAQLFFLWGQELATQSRQSPNPQELRQKAIGAFAKVIDLHAELMNESRINLEILLLVQSVLQEIINYGLRNFMRQVAEFFV